MYLSLINRKLSFKFFHYRYDMSMFHMTFLIFIKTKKIVIKGQRSEQKEMGSRSRQPYSSYMHSSDGISFVWAVLSTAIFRHLDRWETP